MSLFQLGRFNLAYAGLSDYKIECDALTADDWECIAFRLQRLLQPFGSVEGVPRGGLPLARALERWVTEGGLLVVDDVWMTGGSITAFRAGRPCQGAVAFARQQPDPWVVPWLTETVRADHS